MTKIDIMTLFPVCVEAMLSESIIGRARERGTVEINCINIRDFSDDKHGKVDDYPYGGGKGMIMRAEPLYLCHEYLCRNSQAEPYTVLMSAQGRTFNQSIARELSKKEHIILVCGHYEGIDERFIEQCVDQEISIGDFVLTGGEIAAAAVADSVCRIIPGVLSDNICFEQESHWNGLLEHPQYTRPDEWRGRRVPDILLSGHHANIEKWKNEMSMQRTKQRRPDLIVKMNESGGVDE